MAAKLILRKRERLSEDGALVEMVIWQLPKRTQERPHGLKYRLYYGQADGTCVVRYDNELGKGDHRHYGGHEAPYQFVSPEQLVADFLVDVAKARGGDDG